MLPMIKRERSAKIRRSRWQETWRKYIREGLPRQQHQTHKRPQKLSKVQMVVTGAVFDLGDKHQATYIHMHSHASHSQQRVYSFLFVSSSSALRRKPESERKRKWRGGRQSKQDVATRVPKSWASYILQLSHKFHHISFTLRINKTKNKVGSRAQKLSLSKVLLLLRATRLTIRLIYTLNLWRL